MREARRIADYQFGGGAGEALFRDAVEFRTSRSGRTRQVIDEGERVATLKASGRFTLGELGARRLHEVFEAPRLRVEFGEESVPYLEDGKNGFAKFVRCVDAGVRARDEVLVTGPGDELLASGRAELSAGEMLDFDIGMAVLVR